MNRNIYSHPLFYEMLHDGRAHDLSIYEQAARRFGQPVLDIGAGTGRVALNLARCGFRVVALEREPSMVARLQQRLLLETAEVQERVTIEAFEFRLYQTATRYPLLICAHNSLAHQHNDEELMGFLSDVKRLLASTGRFCFDLPVPNPRLLAGHVGYVPWFRDPLTGRAMRCTERVTYDASTQLLAFDIELLPLELEAATTHLRLELRQFFPEQIAPLLQRAGLQLEEERRLGDETFYCCRF